MQHVNPPIVQKHTNDTTVIANQAKESEPPIARKSNTKLIVYIVAFMLVCAAAFFGSVAYLANKIPIYSQSQASTFAGYSYKTLQGWARVGGVAESDNILRYEDYIDASKKDSPNNLYAQQVIAVEGGVINKADLTSDNKAKLKAELNKTDGIFFEKLKNSGLDCSEILNKQVTVQDAPKQKNAFIAANYSFECSQNKSALAIKVVGSIVFSTDGSAATTAVVTSDKVYQANALVFDAVINSVEKL